MYSTYDEEKSAVAERFIRTLKNKISKHMTAILKNVYFGMLGDIVNKYNNTVHRTIEIKPIDVMGDSYTKYHENFNKKDRKFNVGDHVRISKYENIVAKGYTPDWSEQVFVVTKVKNTVPWTYIVNDLNGEETIGSFYEKEMQKTSQEEFRIEKVLKKKVINCMSTGKGMIIHLIAGLIKKISYVFKRH